MARTRRRSYQKGNLQWHNSNWTVRYWERAGAAGKWRMKRHKLEGHDDPKKKKAARKAADEFIATINKYNNSTGPRKVYSEITFGQFIEGRWKAYTVSARHQPSTIESHNSLIKNHLLPFFGDKAMAEVTPSDISDFLERMKPVSSANTMQNLYGLLRLMFDIAHQYDLIGQSPVRPKLHKPEVERVEKPTLRASEIRAVLERLLDEQERLFALLISVTGMRMGEALALRWVDFDAGRLELTIAHTLFRWRLKQPKTESSKRPLRLVPAVASLLVSHRRRSAFQSDGDFIFCRADGRPLNATALRNHLYKAMDGAGIERKRGQYGFHIFRHSAGTLLYEKSRDLKLVQGTLGHADISTTSDIYVHLDDKVLGEGTEILAGEILANCDLFVTHESKMVS
jgi:integrase